MENDAEFGFGASEADRRAEVDQFSSNSTPNLFTADACIHSTSTCQIFCTLEYFPDSFNKQLGPFNGYVATAFPNYLRGTECKVFLLFQVTTICDSVPSHYAHSNLVRIVKAPEVLQV